MSHAVTLSLPDDLFQALAGEAAAQGMPVALHAEKILAESIRIKRRQGASDAEREQARQRVRAHFGSVDLGSPTGVDNESIDRDLAREYGDSHES